MKIDFPTAIYFDTNSIRSLSVENTNPTYLELKELTEIRTPAIPLLIPEVVKLEWLYQHNETYNKKLNQTQSNIIEIEQLLGMKQPALRLPRFQYPQVYKTFINKINTLGLQEVKTPSTISIKELLIMAAFKVRPFEDKGEKGFRDAIILYTILENLKNYYRPTALYITSDKIFLHDDVKATVNKYKVNLIIINSFSEASTYIKGALDNAKKQYLELQNKKQLAFIKSKSKEVYEFILEKAQISEEFIRMKSLFSKEIDIIGKIERVEEFKPTEIKSVHGLLELIAKKRNYPKDVLPITISVRTKLKVIYLPFLLYNRPTVKVPELDKFREKLLTNNVQYYGDAVEKELTREISVEALIKKDKNNNFVDLELVNVYTL